MRTKVILIQGAMDIEINILISSLQDPKEENIEGFKFVSGVLDDINVVVGKTFVGKINASLATYIGVNRFTPWLVINQGTAGAHERHLKIGDIIVGKSYINSDAYRTTVRAKGEKYSITERRLTSDFYNGTEWGSGARIDGAPELVNKALKVSNPYGGVIKGVIATGDGFNKEYDAIIEMNERYGSTCEDMETFASAQVCQHLMTPFLGVRVISNNELTGEPFVKESCEICQRYCLSLIKNI